MGCFDTIRVPCPKCHHVVEEQSKAGDLQLKVYDLKEAPPLIVIDLTRDCYRWKCTECGTLFKVRAELINVETYRDEDDFSSWCGHPRGSARCHDCAE